MQVETIIVAIIGGTASCVGAYFAYRATVVSKKIDNAVNNRHPEHPTIFDVVLDHRDKLHEVHVGVAELNKWKDGYQDSPWNDGEGVLKWLEDHGAAHERIEEALARGEVTMQEIIECVKKGQCPFDPPCCELAKGDETPSD